MKRLQPGEITTVERRVEIKDYGSGQKYCSEHPNWGAEAWARVERIEPGERLVVVHSFEEGILVKRDSGQEVTIKPHHTQPRAPKAAKSPNRPLEDDVADITRSFERAIDELAILRGADDKLDLMMSIIDWRTPAEPEAVLGVIKEGKIKGIHEWVSAWVSHIEEYLSRRGDDKEQYQVKPGPGTREWGEPREGDIEIIATREVTPEEGDPPPPSKWSRLFVHTLIDGTEWRTYDSTSHRTRPVKPIDPRMTTSLRGALQQLQDLTSDANRRHKITKPMSQELLDRLAGAGPKTHKEVCQLYYQIQLEYGGNPTSSSASQGRGDQKNVYDIVCKVKNIISHPELAKVPKNWPRNNDGVPIISNDSLYAVYEIPRDYKFHEWAKPTQTKHSAKELRELKARLVALTKELVALVPPDAHKRFITIANWGSREPAFDAGKINYTGKDYWGVTPDGKMDYSKTLRIQEHETTHFENEFHRIGREFDELVRDHNIRYDSIESALRKEFGTTSRFSASPGAIVGDIVVKQYLDAKSKEASDGQEGQGEPATGT